MLTLAIGNPINSQKGIISLIRGAMSPNQQISQSLEASSQSMIYFNPLIPIFKKFLGMTHMIPHIKTLLELPSLFQREPPFIDFCFNFTFFSHSFYWSAFLRSQVLSTIYWPPISLHNSSISKHSTRWLFYIDGEL